MTMTRKCDAEIQKDVLRELAWDTRVVETEIGVSVHGGVVTLSGTVDSWGKRLAAQQAAHREKSAHKGSNEAHRKQAEIVGLKDGAIAIDIVGDGRKHRGDGEKE